MAWSEIERGGWRVTQRGTGQEVRLTKARKEHQCSGSAHYQSTGVIGRCDKTIAAGEVYAKVRTAAWPVCDDPMHIECAAAAGWVESAPERAELVKPAWLKRGARFRAFPTRSVRTADGKYGPPVWRVTLVRMYPGEIAIHYRVDDEGTKGQWTTTLTRLQDNGLEILP